MPVADDPLLTFEEKTHTYYHRGVWVPNVTLALEAAGMYDFGDANPYQLLQARERGRIVHKLIELDWLGELDEASVDPLLGGYLEAYWRARRDLRLVPAQIEHMVYHAGLRYAGTRDFLGDVGGKDGVIDFKTGYEQRATGPQTAGYGRAKKATARLPRFGLYLQADGTYSLVPYKDAADWTVFCAALSLLNWKGLRHA
jgi:hypothetical protein